MMSTMIERRGVRGEGEVVDLVPLPPPSPESLPTSTDLPIELSASYQAALRRVMNCPAGCLCRGTTLVEGT